MNFRYLQWDCVDLKNIDKYILTKSFEGYNLLSTRQKRLHLEKYSSVKKKDNSYYLEVNTDDYLIVFKEKKEFYVKSLVIRFGIVSGKELYDFIKKEKVLGVSKDYCFEYMKSVATCGAVKKLVFYVYEYVDHLICEANLFRWYISFERKSLLLLNLRSFFLNLGILPSTLYFYKRKPDGLDEYPFFKGLNCESSERELFLSKEKVNPFCHVPGFCLNLENYDSRLKGVYLGDYSCVRKKYLENETFLFLTKEKELFNFSEKGTRSSKKMYYSLHGLNRCVYHFLSENVVDDIYDFWLWLVRQNKFMLSKYENVSEITTARLFSSDLITLGNITSAIVNYQANNNFYYIPYRCGELSKDREVCGNRINSIKKIIDLKNELKKQKFFVYCYDDKFDKLKKYLN